MGKARRWLGVTALIVSFCNPSAALADSDESGKDKPSEFTAVPFAGGDSDVGFGGGIITSWARVSTDYDPYLWRVEGAGAVTLKRLEDAWVVPYTDAYVLVDAPHVIPNKLKLRLRLSYTRELELQYAGLGNTSANLTDSHDPATRYRRLHPTAELQSELKLERELRLQLGVSFTENWLEIPPESRLARDLREGSETVRRLLADPQNHSVLLFSYGAMFDTRDDEINPSRGIYASARVDLGPGPSGTFRHRWGRANGSVRGFVPLIDSYLILAGRVVGDFLFGDAPFYELPRYDSTSAIGGVSGVRGIPAQRYFGKVKVFGNLELRSELVRVQLFGKPTRFGVTGFFDAGRVWAEYRSNPELDGTTLGIKYGTGAGLRVAAGKSFVLRFDVAWSREASPIAAYLVSGHAF